MSGLCAPLPTLRPHPHAWPDARLGADVDRYSFTVVDLHHLLLAGLPAHSLKPESSPLLRLQMRSPPTSSTSRGSRASTRRTSFIRVFEQIVPEVNGRAGAPSSHSF